MAGRAASHADATLAIEQNGRWSVLMLGGDWIAATATAADAALVRALSGKLEKGFPPDFAIGDTASEIAIDISGVGQLDITGAWLIHRTRTELEECSLGTRLSGASAEHRLLIDRVAEAEHPPPTPPPRENWGLTVLARIGRGMIGVVQELRDLTGFFGLLLSVALRTVLNPARLRRTATVHHMEQVGLNAVPIVMLMSFLVGIVLAFQGAQQLQAFGAEIYTVNLVALSVMREIGVLMTAILVAGRSGSAFTAEIGSMKLREEVDAMQTLGLDPMETLVLPRVVALVLMLPVLTFLADIAGLLGGILMAWGALDVSPGLFLVRLQTTTDIRHFWLGMVKAPVFAVVIAMVGCRLGLNVSGSAESLGRLTTRSVVVSIFLVIILDALFSVLFSSMGI